jgi:hypothetical protein
VLRRRFPRQSLTESFAPGARAVFLDSPRATGHGKLRAVLLALSAFRNVDLGRLLGGDEIGRAADRIPGAWVAEVSAEGE